MFVMHRKTAAVAVVVWSVFAPFVPSKSLDQHDIVAVYDPYAYVSRAGGVTVRSCITYFDQSEVIAWPIHEGEDRTRRKV